MQQKSKIVKGQTNTTPYIERSTSNQNITKERFMDAYFRSDSRRAIDPEIRNYISDKTKSTVVYGFSEVVKLGDAIPGGERISGFAETFDSREWYLPLSAKTGFSWKTALVPASTKEKVAFILSVGFGNGSLLPQPSGQWDIYVNNRFALSIRVVKHSQLWQRDDCSFAFAANRIEAAEPFGSLCLSSVIQSESFAAFGPAFLTVPASWLKSNAAATIRIEPKSDISSTRWFQLGIVPNIIDSSDIYQVVDLLTSKRVPKIEGYNVYFGDIHTHSGQVFDETKNKGCGWGTREENYQYARGAGGLDFYALTDHEWQINPDKIKQYFTLADKYNEDGRFVCLPGYEFTNLLYGHRNVYFQDCNGTVINANKVEWGRLTKDPGKVITPEEFWKALEKTGSRFITIPHHPSATSHPCTWAFYNPEYDRLVEVYSAWGSSEYYGDFPRGISDRYRTLDVRDALKRGLRMGLIASSDGHDGHPGNAQSAIFKNDRSLFHHLGSGRIAVLSKELTREAIFDAMYDRRCYATTGVPIVLQFDINGALMGSELSSLPEGARPRLNVLCRGTNGIDHIRIVRNSKVIHSVPCYGEFTYELEWEDFAYSARTSCYYYVRVVQVDKESAWSSPIWIG